MDQFNTRTYIKKGFIFFGVLILLALVYPTYQWFANPTTGISDPTELDFGLAPSANEVNALPSGQLYLYGTAAVTDEDRQPASNEADANPTPTVFTYKIKDNSLHVAPTTLSDEVLENTDSPVGVYVGRNESPENPADTFHPAWVNYQENLFYFFDTPSLWNEGVIEVSGFSLVDGKYITYDGQVDDLSETDGEVFAALQNWNVVVHNPYTGDTRVIEAAARPVWLNDGADVVYLKADGIYRYNIAADASEKIAGGWQNLDRNAQLAIAGDSSSLLLTIPAVNSLAVYTFSDSINGEMILQGIIADEETRYTDPVFAPDNRTYAVLVANTVDWNEETARYNTKRIEFRNIFSRGVVDVASPNIDYTQPHILLDWRAEVAPYEWR